MFAKLGFSAGYLPLVSTCSRHRAGGIAISIACALALAALALRARAESPNSAAGPTSLSLELTAELQLVYRDNVPEFEQRSERLRQTIAAWNASGKSEADRTQLAAWFHDAIRASMPGANQPLPPAPSFRSDTAAPETKVDQTVLAKGTPVTKSKPSQSLIARTAKSQTPIPSDIANAAMEQLPAEARSYGDTKEPAAGAAASRDASPVVSEGDPFRDDAVPGHASDNNQATPAGAATQLPSVGRESTSDQVHVRLDELAPRIQGFEMALRGMEAKLIAGKLSTNELAELSTKLAKLADQRQFLALYVGALSPAEQQQVPSLRSLEPTTRLLAQGVAERRAALQQAGVDDADPKRSQERTMLDQLASELKQSLAMHASAK
jgi:hypothetical protein